MSSLPRMDPEGVAGAASLMKITDHVTGMRVPWVPNAEQIEAWRAMACHRLTYIAKPRQVGVSTAVDFYDVLWTRACDYAGHRVSSGTVVDTYEKSLERVALCTDFAQQLRIAHEATSDTITYPNGSRITALTAGGRRVAASMSFQRFHLTEVPFWNDDVATFTSLMQALSLDGCGVIETTMDIKKPLGKRLWQTPNEWHKVFFPLEMHEEYRRDPSTLRPDQIEWLRAEGFTKPEAMAWFVWAVENKCGGDVIKAFREYPQRPEHMFQSAEGRWVILTPQVTRPTRLVEVVGVNGDVWGLEIYREPEATSRQLLLGVDTATGKEQDRSVVVVTDKRDDAICAAFVDNTVAYDDLALVAQRAQEIFTYKSPPAWEVLKAPAARVPPALIENNGVGDATVKACRRLGVIVEEVVTSDASRYDGLLEAKRAIEAGRAFGPKDLADEADELHRDELGRFKGRKDLMMAYGFTLVGRRRVPFNNGPDLPPPSQARFADRLKRERRLRQSWK